MSNAPTMHPQRPTHIPDYADVCLNALAAGGLGDKISLGGAFGLLHYLDYRPTFDVDAWWSADVSAEDQSKVIDAIETVLGAYGAVRRRAWGDVVSIELQEADRKTFSFQIARRSVQLSPSIGAGWVDTLLDSFDDLIASKMVALVERGAPRDFWDVYTVCREGLVTPARCWALWRRRQELAASDADPNRARLALETHLARIAQHRPLAGISDPAARQAAETTRAWFQTEFLNALLD